MGKNYFTSQTALKSALFLALAANIAYNPFSNPNEPLDLHSVDETVAAGSSAPVYDDKAGTRPQSPNALKLEEPTLIDSLPKTEDTLKICGQIIAVTYQENSVANKKRTEIFVSSWENNPAIKGFIFTRDGAMDLNRSNEDRKVSIEKTITERIKSDLAKSNKSCIELAPSSTTTPPEPPQGDEVKISEERLREDGRKCRRDRNGEILEEPDRMRCNLERLSNISSDSEDERRAASQVMREIESILKGDLKKGIRNRLISEDESIVEEGYEFIQEAADSIQMLADEYRLDRSKVNRWLGQLEAMKAGGATYRRAMERSQDVNALAQDMAAVRNDLNMALAQYRANPADPYASQQVLLLQQQDMQMMQYFDGLHRQVQADMNSGAYAQLLRFRQNGLVDSNDFNLFTGPYDGIRREMSMMLSPSVSPLAGNSGITADPSTGPLGPTMTPPADLLTFRAGLASRFGRNYGAPLPQHPNISMGNYGSSVIGNGIPQAPTYSPMMPITPTNPHQYPGRL